MRDEKRLVAARAVYTGAFLITMQDARCPALDETGDLYQQLRDRDQDDAPLVLFMVLDALSASFQSVLGRLDAALDELEAHALGGVLVSDYLQRIVEIWRVLTPIARALGPYRADLGGMIGEQDDPGVTDQSHERVVVAAVAREGVALAAQCGEDLALAQRECQGRGHGLSLLTAEAIHARDARLDLAPRHPERPTCRHGASVPAGPRPCSRRLTTSTVCLPPC
jgi:Mg2+ and Co2+ transporter CorA